jgi:hypothetical protein
MEYQYKGRQKKEQLEVDECVVQLGLVFWGLGKPEQENDNAENGEEMEHLALFSGDW